MAPAGRLLRFTGTFLAGRWEVRYDRYSDDGRTFLTGTESLTTPGPTLLGIWRADLQATGRHSGRLRGELTVTRPAKVTGTVTSDVDGVRSSGLPTQADCPGTKQPPLILGPIRIGDPANGRIPLTVEVTARVPEDPTLRPVTGATVTVGGAQATTDDQGVARLVLPAGERLRLTAAAGGFRPVSTELGE
ncbi:hypothetical protein [Planomonospora sp. ID82291]|uniref:hypothetical protein n=1 Tax=Planomonospora sp. ID82291 TaxID=2738136 RepID=UPI0018C3B2CC|nr:hypothetical protein [Planomonospora sp. ID82291]MBG0816497.1 hypothetical protein [Planomonospora sp. ID82291]